MDFAPLRLGYGAGTERPATAAISAGGGRPARQDWRRPVSGRRAAADQAEADGALWRGPGDAGQGHRSTAQGRACGDPAGFGDVCPRTRSGARRGRHGEGSGHRDAEGTGRLAPESRTHRSQPCDLGRAAARHKLGLDLEDFARHIREATGWDMLPEAIAAWEDDVLPPGDVVLACLAVTQGIPALVLPLLAEIPPAFPPEALAGPWLTCYQFSHAGK